MHVSLSTLHLRTIISTDRGTMFLVQLIFYDLYFVPPNRVRSINRVYIYIFLVHIDDISTLNNSLAPNDPNYTYNHIHYEDGFEFDSDTLS